jgi:hypothetical protein
MRFCWPVLVEGKGGYSMSIEISQETEAHLAAEARRLGISVDELLTPQMLFTDGTSTTMPVEPRSR